jgi:prephenate dehydratase
MQIDLQKTETATHGRRIAVQGVSGCFSHQALLEFWPWAEAVFCERGEETALALQAGRADGVLLPVENSIAGPVTEHQEIARRLCTENEARVVAERAMAIRQQLIGLRGADVEQLKVVYSHPVALAQCGRFFSQRPWLRGEPYFDTAGSVARVLSEQDPTQAAIAGALAADIYGGTILLPDVQDAADNTTRFVLLWGAGSELPVL